MSSEENRSVNEDEERIAKGIELSIRLPSKIVPRKKRASIVMRKIREYVSSVTNEERIRISTELAQMIWSRGIEKPPRVVKVSIEIDEDEGVATVFPAEVDHQD